MSRCPTFGGAGQATLPLDELDREAQPTVSDRRFEQLAQHRADAVS